MALTLRTNGSGGTNIIQAAWFNDFLNLLTGSMSDQPVSINNGLTLKADTFTTPTAPTLALAAGTALSIGAYTYGIGFQMGNGKTLPGTTAPITTTTGNQDVNLTAIPTGPTGTTARVVYRSKVGTTSPLYLVASINDNTTTTYSDTTADASLTVLAPTHNSFGGYLLIQDSSGNNKAQIFADGSASFDAGNISSNGSGVMTLAALVTNPAPTNLNGGTAGTAVMVMGMQGELKIVKIFLNGFQTAGSTQNLVLPVAFTTWADVWTGNIGNSANSSGINLLSGGSAVLVDIMTSLSSTGGSTTSTSSAFYGVSYIMSHLAFDTVRFNASWSAAHTGSILIIGQ